MADIDKLFEQITNDVLTEDVKLEMAVLFENSLNEAIKVKEAELEEKFKADFIAEKEDLVNKLDAYLEAFCEEFVQKNAAVIEESVKVKTAERVLKTFSAIVNDFNLKLDEQKIDVEGALKESKQEINKLTNELIASKKEVKIREKAALVAEACHGLDTDLEKAKLVEFAKGLPYDELFEKKLGAFVKTTLTESKAKETEVLKEKIEIKEDKIEIIEEKTETPMDGYLKKL